VEYSIIGRLDEGVMDEVVLLVGTQTVGTRDGRVTGGVGRPKSPDLVPGSAAQKRVDLSLFTDRSAFGWHEWAICLR
jgi:hypothetical protein